MTRTRGTMVRVFDARNGGTVPAYGYALATVRGTAYVLCTEGVGWEVTEDRPLIVDTFGGEYTLTLAEVRERAERGTDTDLADFVRTFGARLDSNFYGWHRRINGANV